MNNVCRKTVIIDAHAVDYNRKYTLCALLRHFHEVVDAHGIEMRMDGDTVWNNYGAIWILTRIRIDVKEQAMWHDEIEVETYPLKPGIVRMEREGTFKKDGKLFAALSSEWCLLDKASGRPRRPDQTGYPMDMPCFGGMMTDGYSKFDPSYADSDYAFSHTVRVSDLDINGHMNNVAYARLALDSFSVKELNAGRLVSFEIAFKAQCFEGEEIKVFRKEENGKYFVSGIKVDGSRVFDTMFFFEK